MNLALKPNVATSIEGGGNFGGVCHGKRPGGKFNRRVLIPKLVSCKKNRE